jgi:hypothetical protein
MKIQENGGIESGINTMKNIITAKCECGNKVDVEIFDHLGGKEYAPIKYAPDTVRTHEALMGQATCSKCGSEVWIYSFIEVHRKEEK